MIVTPLIITVGGLFGDRHSTYCVLELVLKIITVLGTRSDLSVGNMTRLPSGFWYIVRTVAVCVVATSEGGVKAGSGGKGGTVGRSGSGGIGAGTWGL